MRAREASIIANNIGNYVNLSEKRNLRNGNTVGPVRVGQRDMASKPQGRRE
jgi:hypothetical protein